MNRSVTIIGSGIAGLSAACFMARAGWHVVVLEKHGAPGGRARQLKAAGFTFDMGPSWYWMPDIFERFFNSFNKKVSDCYTLNRLDPSYRVYWPNSEMDIPANYTNLQRLFEQIEPNSSHKLDEFLKQASYKYRVGMYKLAYKPGQSLTEFLDRDLLMGIFKLDVFNSIRQHVKKYFASPLLQQLMEFPVLFLGALPAKIPALYSFMNYADIRGGTWYPEGGIYKVIDAIYNLATELGVKFYFNHTVSEIIVDKSTAKKIVAKKTSGQNPNAKIIFEADVIIGGADYHHIESALLPHTYRSYSETYWNKKIMAPGCLLYYVGLNKRLKNIAHHSLFFDTSFEKHGKEIYETRSWPSDPLFYVSATSVTDKSVAPEGCENLFFLVPVAAGLADDSQPVREAYFDMIVRRMERRIDQSIAGSIIYKKTFAHSDFVHEYNSFKGSAYGLANTLSQTANLKPACRSKKVKNLFYTGQLTIPGPGVPPALISGEVVSRQVIRLFGN